MAESQAQGEPQGEQSAPDSALGEAEKSARRKSKTRAHRPIVESLHIRTMVSSYKHHITLYSKDREQVNQLIPSAVWKGVYAHYIKHFPNSPFVEETLKDRLRETIKEMQSGKYADELEEPEKMMPPLQSAEVVARLKDRLRETLKELRNGTFNEEDFEKAVLQSDEVFQDSLRPPEDHASRNNALKRKLSMMNGEAGVAPSSYCMPDNSFTPGVMSAPRNSYAAGPPSSYIVQPGSSSMPSPHLSSTSPPPMTKSEMLQQQSRSITAIATQFLSNSEKRDALVAAEMDYHRAKSRYYDEKTRKLKIGNLKLLRDAGVISEEEFKQQVKLA